MSKLFINFNLSDMASKWNDFDWVNTQYVKHLDEVRELFDTKDDHLFAEVIDLLAIAKQLTVLGVSENLILKDVRLWTQVSKSNMSEELINKRLDKFLEKASLDKDA